MEETYMSVFKKRVICASLVMAVVLAIVANNFDGLVTAQSNKATVSGTVTDEKGAVVANVKVIARNLDTNISRDAISDGVGRYRIPELPPGQYEVTAEAQGFRPRIHRGIELTVGREVVVNFLLNVGNVEDKVIIEEDASPVETVTSALGYLVNRKQIE
jgi:hypothetical protein